MSSPAVVAVFLHSKKAGPMTSVEEVRAESGRGLEGDTYFREDGGLNPEQEITLVEIEAIEAFREETGLPFGIDETRRNVVTRGVGLNGLVGKEFRVGEATLRGVEPCHPCQHLERLTRPGVLKGFADRGGLRARIVSGGTIRVGDPVVA